MTSLSSSNDNSTRSGVNGKVWVCVLGQSFWVERVEAGLRKYGEDRVKVFVPTSGRWRPVSNLKQAVTSDVLLRMGYRPGARSVRGRAFDAFWRALRLLNPDASRIFYWLGTDVLRTVEDWKSGQLRFAAFESAKKDAHFTDAPWLSEELKSIGIKSLSLPVTMCRMQSADSLSLPKEFAVLTYIPDCRPAFYGGECIYNSALELPEVRFDVVGGHGSWIPRSLPNLKFHGWQADMAPFYRGATVVVRMVQHDGTGLTAVEGLSLGRHVIYSFPLPYTTRVTWGDSIALTQRIRELLDQQKRGVLDLNYLGRRYAMREFDEQRGTENLISQLLRIRRDSGSR
jgi:hypothetical protein